MFDGEGWSKVICFFKCVQIFVVDLWVCFNGEFWGEFCDIDKIMMFVDYCVLQIFIIFGVLYCSFGVVVVIKGKEIIESGGRWEVQLRGKKIFYEYVVVLLLMVCSLQYLVCRVYVQGD